MKGQVALVALFVCAGAASAQDMPLSMVLLPEEGWRAVAGDWSAVSSLASGSNGDVYVAHQEGRQIARIDRDGRQHAFARPSASVMGLAFAPDGRLYACQTGENRIVALDARGKENVIVEHLPASCLAVTREGVIYASLPSENAIYRVSRDGKKQRVADRIPGAFGVTLWVDQGTLVVGDKEGSRLTAFRIDKDGSLDARERYYTLRRQPGKDGPVAALTVDRDRRLYAATDEGVQVFDPTGRMSGVLLRPGPAPIVALAFGGADLDRLYVICASKLYVRKTKAKGVAVALAKAQ
jgi:enterochelin esterase family protein